MRLQQSNFTFRPIKWLHFINEAHPIFPNIAFSYISFTAVYLYTLNFAKLGSFSWTDFIIGSTAYSFLILSLRAFDELKDQETDIINFPNRPLVKGIVARSDLYTFSTLLIVIPLVLHLIFFQLNLATQIYTLAIFYSLMVYKWFYLENILKSNITLTFLTHQPLVYLLKLYTVSFLATGNSLSLDKEILIIIFIFALAENAWEISRKTKQNREENEYSTYSKSWGRKTSVYLSLSALYASTGLFAHFAYTKISHFKGFNQKAYYLAAAIPICTLVLNHFRGRMFLNGQLKGEDIKNTVELHIGALTTSALILSSLHFII